jgi:hypothetical protein
MAAHPLQHMWVLWEHKSVHKAEDWPNSMREVCEFSSAEEFWKYWSFVPKPSEVLFDGQTRKGEHRKKSDWIDYMLNRILKVTKFEVQLALERGKSLVEEIVDLKARRERFFRLS